MTPEEKQNLEVTKNEIQKLGLGALKNYLVIDPLEIDKDKLHHLMHKAKLGLQFEKEMNVNKRAGELNQIRIWRLTTDDKKQLSEYVKTTMPQYSTVN